MKEILAGGDLTDDLPQTERFGLFWPGKTAAIRAAQTPTTATLAPDFGESLDWDTTQNVFIEGDNLEVLKILQKHYYGKIKMIYIDPPYNTGKDFVYRDNFRDGIGAYLEMTGQADESGKLSTNSESDGRYHSNWLNMMYPRLKLARNLLREDGIVCISIDSSEHRHLLSLCTEIFGEGNLLADLAVVNNLKGRSDDEFFATANEFLVVCARNSRSAKIYGFPLSDADLAEYKFSDGISRYKEVSLQKTGKNSRREDRPNMYYAIYYSQELQKFSLEPFENAIAIFPSVINGNEGRWRWGKDTFQERKETELVARMVGDKWRIYVKMRDEIEGERRTLKPKTIWLDPKYDTGNGGRIVKELFEGLAVFDSPKSTLFLSDVIQIVTEPKSLVLDFFAGSGTTAHAVMQLNAEDGGNRRCISVQLPEVTGEKSEARKAGYSVISQISRERIRRAGAKIHADYADTLKERETPLDTGFRAYRLVDTNFRKWQIRSDADLRQIQDALEDSVDTARDEATPAELLTEVMLKLGLSLSEHVAETRISGLDVFTIGDGLMLAYLNEHHSPTLEQLRALVAEEPAKLVLLEDALKGDDQLKTNLAQECAVHNVELWTV